MKVSKIICLSKQLQNKNITFLSQFLAADNVATAGQRQNVATQANIFNEWEIKACLRGDLIVTLTEV